MEFYYQSTLIPLTAQESPCHYRSAAHNTRCADAGACKRASLSDRFALSRPHGSPPADPKSRVTPQI